MSKRRLDKLEGSLFAKEAVLRWLDEAQAYRTLPAYVHSLIDEPEAAQPFIALPSQVENAVWGSMRREPRDLIKKVMREAITDTIFLLRLVIDLNVHVEQTLRVERLRQVALYWWSRALDSDRRAKGAPSPERDAVVATLLGTVRGIEEALRDAETRYLDSHGCLFPDLVAEWEDLRGIVEAMAGLDHGGGDTLAHESAMQATRQVIRMARADALDAVGSSADADAVADRVARADGGLSGGLT
jgi:hypothetical protein